MRELGNEEMPIMLEILIINFAKGASRTGSVSHTGKNFGKVYTPKSDTDELSEGNGEERKRVEREFDGKRV
nr:hypothetical protein [Capnocytophaga leadbetteri]